MKKQTFDLPYIGIDEGQLYPLLYTDNGDSSVVIDMINPIIQYSADQDGYYEFHALMNNILKLLDIRFKSKIFLVKASIKSPKGLKTKKANRIIKALTFWKNGITNTLRDGYSLK
jgi:hypothetical protein